MEDELSFSEAIELYNERIMATKASDINALNELKRKYPFIFTQDFLNFINEVKECMRGVHKNLGKDFSYLFETKN